MRQALALTVLGVSLLTIGLFLSPAPFLAPIVAGLILVALGLLKDFD